MERDLIHLDVPNRHHCVSHTPGYLRPCRRHSQKLPGSDKAVKSLECAQDSQRQTSCHETLKRKATLRH
jgi:hypothetical protein